MVCQFALQHIRNWMILCLISWCDKAWNCMSTYSKTSGSSNYVDIMWTRAKCSRMNNVYLLCAWKRSSFVWSFSEKNFNKKLQKCLFQELKYHTLGILNKKTPKRTHCILPTSTAAAAAAASASSTAWLDWLSIFLSFLNSHNRTWLCTNWSSEAATWESGRWTSSSKPGCSRDKSPSASRIWLKF